VISRLVLVLTVAVAGVMSPATLAGASSAEPRPAPAVSYADVAQGERCRDAGRVTFKIRDVRHAIKVGYAKRFYLSPGERVTTIRNVTRDMTVRARYRVSGGGTLGASGAARLLVRAEIRVNASLVAFGSYNKATDVTIRRTVVNDSSRNRKFVAFQATHQYRGRYTRFHCQKHPLQTYPTWVSRGTGEWRSHQSFESGTLRCGAGYPGAVAKFVGRRHCS